MLAAIGIGTDEEAIYTLLLDSPPMTIDRLRGAGALAQLADLERTVAHLEDKGMISRLPGTPVRFVPVAPDLALINLVLDRQNELDRSRAMIAELSHRFQGVHRGAGAAGAVEIVSSDQAVPQRIDLALRSARAECRVLERPPYNQAEMPVPPVERDLLARGIRVRTVYDHSATDTIGMGHLLDAHQLGEEVRIVSKIAVRLWLVDDRLALLPMTTGHVPMDGLLVIHPCALLDALSELFERTWSHATPLAVDKDKVASATASRRASSEAVMGLLVAGYTDSAIARHLGIGLRTVERRIREVMQEVNATTRFQAGVIVGRTAWGTDPAALPIVEEKPDVHG